MKKYYWLWVHWVVQNCPSGKINDIIIFNIISYLMYLFKGWWRRGWDEPLTFCLTPYLPLNPLVLLMMKDQKT